MQVLFDVPSIVTQLDQESKSLIAAVISEIDLVPESIKIQGGSDVFEQENAGGKLLQLTEGAVHCRVSDRALYLCDEGDLIGFERELKYETDFAVIANAFDSQEFLTEVAKHHDASKKWIEFLGVRSQIHAFLCAAALQSDLKFEPEVRMYLPGDTIVSEGDTSSEVFTMTEGKGEVFVDSVKVGEVIKDEIFGAIAALTGTPRTATVIAEQSCMVLCLDKNSFIELIRSRPNTVNKLIGDMARRLVSLNERVVKLEQGNAG